MSDSSRRPIAADRDRWLEMKRIFHDAMDRDPLARPAFLDAACAGRADLRSEIESLIGSHESNPGFMEPPRFGSLSPLVEEEEEGEKPDSLVGERLGAYRIERLVGRGGMGSVYSGVRADGRFERRIAVKVIKRGMDTDEILRRFQLERETLGRLEHANIARLLDAGTLEDGRPYLLMEFVDGQPIDRYCEKERLSIGARLELFRGVCAAVEYAHSRLVVHRDLKPANILVARGVPKLLDFGIAKLMRNDPDLSAATADGSLPPFTLEYASPEQLKGEPVTTATDVYALGQILYELLTGRRAHRFATRTRREIERTICEIKPERPSLAVARTGPRSLGRRLKGDLDNILLRALEKDPARRYASVQAFSEDIRRHLEGLPTLARRPTAGYLAAKFIGRNRLLVGGAGALVLTLVLGAAGTLSQSSVARAEKERAILSQTISDRISRFLAEMLESVSPANALGHDVTVREALDAAARRIESELEGLPLVEAAVRTTIGKTYASLGLLGEASAHVEAALRLREERLGTDSVEVAESRNDLGAIRCGQLDLEAAERLYVAALESLERARGRNDLGVATVLNGLALVKRMRAEFAEARLLYEEALAIRRRLSSDDDLEVAEVLNNLTGLLRVQGDLDGAERLCREVLAIRRKKLGPDHPDLAQSLDNVGVVLMTRGDAEEAEPYLRESLALFRKVLPPGHPDLAVSLSNLAALYCRTARFAEAEAPLRECLRMREASLPAADPRLIAIRTALGECLLLLGRLDEAESELLESFDGSQLAADESPAQAAQILRLLVDLYERQGDADRAAECRSRLQGIE